MKRGLILIGLLILAYLTYHHKAVKYGLEQAYGQFQVLSSAQSLEEYLKSEPADSMVQKISLIQKVKSFAEDSLGLKVTDSYSSIYDQKGKPILWVVTAAPEFELKAHQWKFPIAGKFEYKGFFKKEKAEKEIEELKASGFDTDLDEVSAWSTLGFFSDPILTSMLERDSFRLADLIIHELTHASIYLKDSVELNENLASFIGKKGAEAYLRSIGDQLSIQKMEKREARIEKWREALHRSSLRLDSLYGSFSDQQHEEEKRALKQELLKEIRWQVVSTVYEDSLEAREKFSEFRPNNAFFTGYLTYRSKSEIFEKEFEEKFDGNLKTFIEYYIEEYGN